MVFIKGIPRGRFRRRPKVILDFDQELMFGMHRNRTVAWVLVNHPQYIDWLRRSSQIFTFTADVLKALADITSLPDYDPNIDAIDFYKEYYKVDWISPMHGPR